MRRNHHPKLFDVRLSHAQHYASVLHEVEKLFLRGGRFQQESIALFEVEAVNIRASRQWVVGAVSGEGASNELLYFNLEYCLRAANFLLQCLISQESVKWFEEALASAIALEDKEAELIAKRFLGRAVGKGGDYRLAIQLFEETVQLAQECGNAYAGAQSMGHLGATLLSAGATELAITWLEQARTLLCQLGRHDEEGPVITDLADAYDEVGDFRKATDLYKLTLNVARKKGNLLEEASALGNLASIYGQMKQPDQATDHAQQARNIFQRIGHLHYEAQSLTQLAGFRLSAGERKIADELIGEAIALYRNAKDRSGECEILGVIASTLWDVKDYDGAFRMYAEQVKQAQAIGKLNREIEATGNMGKVLVDAGSFDLGVRLLEASCRRAHEYGNHNGEHVGYCMLGNVHLEAGQRDKALIYFQRERELAKSLRSVKKEVHALQHLADIYEKQTDLHRASQLYEEMLKVSSGSIDPHDGGGVHREYALMLGRNENFDAALEHSEAAQGVFEKMQDLTCLGQSKVMVEAFRQRKVVERKEGVLTVIENNAS